MKIIISHRRLAVYLNGVENNASLRDVGKWFKCTATLKIFNAWCCWRPTFHCASTAAYCVRLRNLAAVQQFQRVTCSIYYLQNVLHKLSYKGQKTGTPSKKCYVFASKCVPRFSCVCLRLYHGCSHKCDIQSSRQQQVTASVLWYNAAQLVSTELLHSAHIGGQVKLLRQECLCFLFAADR